MGEEVFNNEVYSGPTQNDFTVKVDKSVSDEAFKATQGKTLADVQRENEQTVNDLFKPQEKIGSVFEKGEKLEEKALTSDKDEVKTVSNNGIDPNDIDALKKGLSNQEPNIKGPSVEPSLNFVK